MAPTNSTQNHHQAAVITRHVIAVFQPPLPTSDSIHQFVDLALLRLNQSVPLTAQIQPIHLPSQGEQFYGQLALASGFGATFFVGL